MIKNEHDFSRNLRHELARVSIHAIPIESHGTRVGIPDLFVMGYGSDIWIELKYVKVNKNIAEVNDITIPYRPGQLGFAKEYNLYHWNKKHILTAVAIQFKDVLAIGLTEMTNDIIQYLIEHNHKMTYLKCELYNLCNSHIEISAILKQYGGLV